MKNFITQNIFKAFLIIAFICLAFYQWKNEKVNTLKSETSDFEQITSISDEAIKDILPLSDNSN